MRRRSLLRAGCVALTVAVPGCGNRAGSNPPNELLIRFPEVIPTDSKWQLRVTTDVTRAITIEDVTIVAYSETGRLAGEKEVGDLDIGVDDHRLECSRFPAIISARTATPCERVMVHILHWIGTDEQKQLQIPEQVSTDATLYESTIRKCDESLPPTRLVSQLTSTTQ